MTDMPRRATGGSLRTLSIKRKLMLITMSTSTVALLLASVGLVIYDLVAFRSQMSDDLMTQAEIVGANSMAALAFRDTPAAREILSALKARESIVAAALYAPDGALVADYRRDNSAARAVPAHPERSGSRFEDNYLRVFHRIGLHGQGLGTVYVESDMQQWDLRLKRYTGIIGLLMLGAALVALLLSSWLQQMISGPILGLQETMRRVSAEQSFALRAVKSNDDEVGSLIDGFNAMLAEIQQRDTALQGVNDSLTARTRELEREVTERLRAQEELKTLNATLELRVAERSAAAEQRALQLARSEEAHQKQSRILQSILDSMSDGVIVADETGRLILVNPAAETMLRLDAEPAPPDQWAHRYGLYLPDTVTLYPMDRFPLMQAVGGEEVADVEVFAQQPGREDGRWLSVNATPLKDEDGVLHNGVAIFHDITARKHAAEELLNAKNAAEAANRAKSQFLANMSHELRTPLNAIIGYSEMLQEQAQDLNHPEAIPDLRRIHSAGKHLQSLIDDILDLSKIEAGKMELFIETFDVHAMVREVVTTIQPLVDRNHNSLDVTYADDLGSMGADLTKVRQILFNLLSNASKFTQRGHITLAVDRRADWMHFRVADTGIGMSPDQMKKLFQDFTQVDASTTRKYGGTGLGLAISRRFCRMMGGEITAQSSLGAGATFECRMPATTVSLPSEAPTASDVPALDRPVSDGTRRRPVLVIDDDPIVHDMLTRLLAKEGLRVVSAFNGADGLRLAETFRPAAITLDVMMPGLDGWAVLTALKGNADLADIPIILVTITDDKNMGYALGAADYLTKPIEPGRLTAVLKKYTLAAQRASVLVVDDDPDMRDITARLLTKGGCEVHVAENGRVALDQLALHTPTLIVLDLMMPEVDGFDFLLALRRQPAWQAIPVVVVTAKEITDEDRHRLNGSVKRILQKRGSHRDDLLVAVRDQVTASLQAPQTR
jgi:signal transduction histidine kinase/DNA-binding response OmpR family regulator/methyl-accepting chemotaxis protein